MNLNITFTCDKPLKKGCIACVIPTVDMESTVKHTSDFIRTVRSNGRYDFTIDELINTLPKSSRNIRKDLDRLKEKGEIVNIRRGFYTILPPEYQNMGVIPVDFYIHGLMQYFSKNYYVGLLSAAMFHGAAHQQPQDFYVITKKPRPRNIVNQNFKINFSEKSGFPEWGIESKKTETGYFNISGPELTMLDLIYFEQNVGGFNRVITILNELNESVTISRMKEAVKNDFPASTFQRAGYMAENLLNNAKIAGIFENILAKKQLKTVLLKSSGKLSGTRDEKWKVIVNTEIEADI